MRRAGLLLIGVLLLAGCAGGLPRPVIERSPLTQPQRHTLYAPLVAQGHNKLGIAGCVSDLSVLGASWCYSWTARPGCVAGETVPMIWDETHVTDAFDGCSPWLMGFNEPDHPGQANLTANDAVAPWAAVEAQAMGRKLVAPVPAYGTRWLLQFRAAFFAAQGRYPRFDALAVHCYAGNARACIDKVTTFEDLARAWGVPEIWVTEFFFADEREARAFVAYLEAEPMVTRYAPFVSRLDCADALKHGYWDCEKAGDPSLLDEDSELTRYGAWYAKSVTEF